MKWDHYEFKIAGHYLSALINGDFSGMEESEVSDFEAWEQWARENARDAGFCIGHWTCDSEESGDFGRCAVSGLFADRQTVRLMVYKRGL